MSGLVPVTIVGVLIALNAFFVAAEFAIVGAPRAALERRAIAGHRGARVVTRVLADPRNQDRYIATAQLGITFVTLGLGMYGEHMLAHWIEVRIDAWSLPGWLAAHTLATLAAIAALTYLHIVLGEMVPKALALQRAEATVLGVTPVMLAIRGALYPLVVALNALGNALLRLAGVDRSAPGTERYYTAEELDLVVEESLSGGRLAASTGRVLHELFEMGGLTAEDVMVPRVQVEGIAVGAGADEMGALLRSRPHTRYPVYGEDLDEIHGTVHVKTLARLVVEGRAIEASDAEPAAYLPQLTPLETVMRRMRDGDTQCAIVLDEFGGTAGLITPDDVSGEILGRIVEEGARPELFDDAVGRLHVAGTVRLDELSRRLDHPVEREEVETVSGLVLHLLGREARVGDAVEHAGFRLRVIAVDGRGVGEAVVQPLRARDAGAEG